MFIRTSKYKFSLFHNTFLGVFRHEWIFYKRTRSSCMLILTIDQASNSAEAGLPVRFENNSMLKIRELTRSCCTLTSAL